MMLEVQDLSVKAGDTRLLGPVSFGVPAGECLVIMGETGAGKSLIAQSVMGSLPPALEASGEIALNGRRIDTLDTRAREALWGRDIAMLPQEPWRALDPLAIALNQVGETHHLVAGLTEREARTRAGSDFRKLGLAGAESLRPGQLSGGMGQRVAFAAAMAGGASVLLADEPTKGLDRLRMEAALELLKAVPDEGGALVVITHDVSVAREMGGRILVLKQGACVEQGATRAVLEAPQHAYTRALIEADPRRWERPTDAPGSETVLQAKDLAVGRAGRVLFEHLDLSLSRGERLAVLGPSGSGKTTLLDTLAGLLPAVSGTVRRAGDVGPTGVQKIYQEPPAAFPSRVSLGTNLKDIAALHAIPWSDIETLLNRLLIGPALLERRPDAVSGGELQRIAIARALAVRPAVLLADEPTSRLDPLTQMDTLRLLADVSTAAGTAILLVTHDEAIANNWAHFVIEPVENRASRPSNRSRGEEAATQ